LYNILIVKYGEIGVKGKNRYLFENKLIKNIRNMIKHIGEFNVYKEYGRIYVDIEDYNYEEVIEEVRKVFGVVGVCPAIKAEKSYDKLKEIALIMLEKNIEEGCKTFKVESRRGDKEFPMTSQEMSVDIGAYLLKNLDGKIKVDVRNPEVKISCEYREHHTMVYSKTIKGYGGLPVGTNGKALSLLSGGIDSPVASWMVAKRGMKLEFVHFHSYPFTNERSQEKVLDLAKIIAKYCGKIKLHKVNILEIQKAISENCHESDYTIVARRFMMRIANKLAKETNCDALVTGESIGQVASQTIHGLTCTNAVVDIPVFRPLIAMDKLDIIDISQNIGTYETSIIPEEDCCSLFAPKNPTTRPTIEKMNLAETKLDIDKLVDEAIEGRESFYVEFE
jgi:thiamine biosynthesis protein ThiI